MGKRQSGCIGMAGAFALCLLGGCGPAAPQAGSPQAYAKIADEDPVSNLPSTLPQKFTPNAARYPFIASKTVKVVHRRDCALTESIAAADRDYFRAFRIAGEQGYKPCEACRPDRQ